MIAYGKKYFSFIIIGLLLMGLFIEGYFLTQSKPVTLNSEEIALEEKNENDATEYIWVEIRGAVNKPGVYEMPSFSVVNDVIGVASGLKEDAYTDNINLSQTVEPNMVINIYTTKEYAKYNASNLLAGCYEQSYDISNCLDGYSLIMTNSEKAQNNEKTLVNINTADKNTLMSLTGIGEAKASAIIDYRESQGNFKNIIEIKNVRGIGDTLYEQIKDYLTI